MNGPFKKTKKGCGQEINRYEEEEEEETFVFNNTIEGGDKTVTGLGSVTLKIAFSCIKESL